MRSWCAKVYQFLLSIQSCVFGMGNAYFVGTFWVPYNRYKISFPYFFPSLIPGRCPFRNWGLNRTLFKFFINVTLFLILKTHWCSTKLVFDSLCFTSVNLMSYLTINGPRSKSFFAKPCWNLSNKRGIFMIIFLIKIGNWPVI